mgnify:CR=1 FL=1
METDMIPVQKAKTPLTRTRLIGFVNLGHKPSLDFYSQDELNLLRSLADSAASPRARQSFTFTRRL